MSESLLAVGLSEQSGIENELNDQYLSFEIAGERYGVNILSVSEIRGWEPVTLLPNSPSYIKGVINIRGEIVPVFDVRDRFEMPTTTYGKTTVIIVMFIKGDSGLGKLGMIVDAVSDVFMASESDMTEPPDNVYESEQNYVEGIIRDNDEAVVILQPEKLITREELKQHYSRKKAAYRSEEHKQVDNE